MSAAQAPVTYKPASGVAVRRVGDETVLVDLDDEQYFSLNETGTVVWSAVSAGRSVDAAIEDLVEQFDVDPERAAGDAGDLVKQLIEHGLLLPAN